METRHAQFGTSDQPCWLAKACKIILQVEQELQRTASKASEVEERLARIKVDQQRLELQLAQSKEGTH